MNDDTTVTQTSERYDISGIRTYPTVAAVRAHYKQRAIMLDALGQLLSNSLTSEKMTPHARRIVEEFFWFFPQTRY